MRFSVFSISVSGVIHKVCHAKIDVFQAAPLIVTYFVNDASRHFHYTEIKNRFARAYLILETFRSSVEDEDEKWPIFGSMSGTELFMPLNCASCKTV